MIQFFVSFFKSVRYWLSDSWRARPCRCVCAACGRAMWTWGTTEDKLEGPYICSDACERKFTTSHNLEGIEF